MQNPQIYKTSIGIIENPFVIHLYGRTYTEIKNKISIPEQMNNCLIILN
jgi:hypothetical protein